ncbi:hypothetical protein [Dankookia sp. P2]
MLVTWKLDRLGLAPSNPVEAVPALGRCGIGGRLLTQAADTLRRVTRCR